MEKQVSSLLCRTGNTRRRDPSYSRRSPVQDPERHMIPIDPANKESVKLINETKKFLGEEVFNDNIETTPSIV